MSDDELEAQVLRRVGMGRRDFVRKLVLGTAFAVPVIASFDMSSLTAASATATTCNGTVGGTELVAEPGVVKVAAPHASRTLVLTAVLTGDCGAPPLRGQTINFSAEGFQFGTAVTNSQGIAVRRVGLSPTADLPKSYQAHFAGTQLHSPATAEGSITQ